MFDVIVAGGGPAGAVAAYQLACSGMSVAVVEKQKLPRYKTCGGGVVGRARSALPFDISGVVEAECLTAGIRLLDQGLSFSACRPQAIISMVMRSDFDRFLLSKAEHAGARLITEQPVQSLWQHRDFIRIQTPEQTLDARFIIAADGAGSAVARLAGWRETRLLALALECELPVDASVAAAFGGSANFDFDVVPGGYGWVFPKRGRLSIGLGVLRPSSRSRHLKRCLERYFRTLGLEAPEDEAVHGYIIPVSHRKDGFIRGRIMLTGDAAGFADPVTGEGITHAIRSGQFAARAIVDAGLDVDRGMAGYGDMIEKELLPELKASRKLAGLLYASDSLRNRLMASHGQRLAEAVTDVFMGTRTYHQSMARLQSRLRSWLRS